MVFLMDCLMDDEKEKSLADVLVYLRVQLLVKCSAIHSVV